MPLPGDELGHEPRVDEGLAGRDLLDRAEQRLVRRLLEDVAARARLEPALEQRALAVRGEDEDGGPGHASRAITSVASSPSMSGMRRSMITTSGRRRSVSATADAPSDASPITRIRGERESARRRPFADDLVVVRDQAGDLIGHAGFYEALRAVPA